MRLMMSCRVYFLVVTLLCASGAIAQDRSNAWVTGSGNPYFVAVLVENVDRSAAWYGSVFGLEAMGGSRAEDDSWRIENLGNEFFQVEIFRDARAKKTDRPLGFRKVGFLVPDVDQIADRVAQATGDRPRVVDDTRFGQRILQLKDPDGNTIQLFSRIE